jgi:hypothetical protein
VVAFAAVPDNEFVLVLCRDTHEQEKDGFLQTLPVRVAPETAVCCALPEVCARVCA